ncbi:cytochrome c oxidase assembly protein [Tranquillimonas alkanivorans]|uniref:Putative membrane protein n=1 Tax=Tranquillimonas alkanivorans TaxID=441119 RepID=A0A1I5RTI1_9RHOB|nr:cytochrome c oxidase assembly protein [Tranquillimonas alkanivorans]SFP61256.1 putative membrane protein [Tranquillimonas alkanivorans]
MTSPPISTLSSEPALSLRRVWPLGSAMIVLAALWGGPLPRLAQVSFTAHMALHLALIGIAAPLAALGLARAGARGTPPGGWVLWGVLFAGFEMMVVWGWHVPALHEAAALVPWIFAAQQASFLLAGLFVWLPGFAASGQASAGAATVALALSFMHMSMLGVLLTTAPGLLYPAGLCGGAFGLDPLTDQRLGGVMMAVFGGLPYLAGAVAFAHRLLTEGPGR